MKRRSPGIPTCLESKERLSTDSAKGLASSILSRGQRMAYIELRPKEGNHSLEFIILAVSERL